MTKLGVRSWELGVIGSLLSYFFDQARSHTADFFTHIESGRTILQEFQAKTDVQKRFKLLDRADADIQKSRKVSWRSSSMALSNVAWDRNRSSSHLRDQSKSLFLGKARGQSVYFGNQVHRLHPDFQVLVATFAHLKRLPSSGLLRSQLPTPNFGPFHG